MRRLITTLAIAPILLAACGQSPVIFSGNIPGASGPPQHLSVASYAVTFQGCANATNATLGLVAPDGSVGHATFLHDGEPANISTDGNWVAVVLADANCQWTVILTAR
jgi:hypothetical protein